MTKSDIFKKALLDSTLKEIKAIEEAGYPIIETDLEYDRKIYNEIGKSKAKINRRNIRISILAAILITLTLIMSISAIRTRVVDFVVSIYEKFICLSIDDDEFDYPTTIETIYVPKYLPESFRNTVKSHDTYTAKNVWNCTRNTQIRLYQQVISNKKANFDNEYVDYTVKFVNDIKIYYTLKNQKYTIVWLSYGYSFMLSCPEELGWNEIEKIILSIEEVPMEQ